LPQQTNHKPVAKTTQCNEIPAARHRFFHCGTKASYL
jgi:hypothetical protein